ncbi:MAG: S-methyl-5-thioribose-1-phosphate isomerase [Bdellovibrionaceae bacterium]|nr:S-methyl-5-thioribose-1-phosphate isomerase [Pseudobdellovibrionaceae bacterium]
MKMNSLALRYENDQLWILDQQLLPQKEEWIAVQSPKHMVDIIKALKVRGAPLIGVAAAASLADWTIKTNPTITEYKTTALMLRESRPTAVNLMNAIDRILPIYNGSNTRDVANEAQNIFAEDVRLCEQMAACANQFIKDGDGILTHCNTGGLATAGRGTAFGAFSYAWEKGKKIHVYADETRPLLQGGRLTSWELDKNKIPHTLICDNMAGMVMASGKVQSVFVGTDRIAMNGDIANKIGTYSVAVLCKYHNIPFYVVGPKTTVDPQCKTGKDIPIEERAAQEVRGASGAFGSVSWSQDTTPVFNPAFDMTPVELITGIIIDGNYFSQKQLIAGELKKLF